MNLLKIYGNEIDLGYEITHYIENGSFSYKNNRESFSFNHFKPKELIKKMRRIKNRIGGVGLVTRDINSNVQQIFQKLMKRNNILQQQKKKLKRKKSP